jgi:hypothetical protein
VDGNFAGMRNSLGTPHEYDLTQLLSPGKHSITIRVDNRIKDVNPGINSHSITDHTQTNWNGIVGDILLTARPQNSLSDIRIFPDIENKVVNVEFSINSTDNKPVKGTVTLKAQSKTKGASSPSELTKEIEATPGTKNYLIEYPMGDNVLLWDEFSPNLYVMDIELETPAGLDTKKVQFGMRTFNADGTRFEINGRPVFLRGTLDCAAFPKTGYPPTDEKEWKRIFQTIKAHGLNHVRFHSWCPPETAFNAADEEGIYLQVECSSWANSGSAIGDGKPIDKWIYEESENIVRSYGNHPSFCMMAYGNEPAGKHKKEYLTKFLNYWEKKDDRRVYTGGAGWPVIPANEYHNIPAPRIQGWGQGLKSIINSQPPRSDYDWKKKIERWDKPVVSHEIGQWCAYPDLKEIDKYTGVLKAKNFEIFKETLEENDLGQLADSFLMASGKLQALSYKADIEAALRTPGFAGFQMLGLSDFPGQGTALVGVLNAFWDEKGYISPEEFRRFSNTTVPLARMKKRVFLNNENFTAGIEISSFEATPLKKVKPEWKITGNKNNILWSGSLPAIDLKTDNCQKNGTIIIPLNSINKAQKLTLSVNIRGFENSWDFWVYPANLPSVDDASVKVVQKLDKQTVDHLNNGGKVILTPVKGSLKPEFGGDIGVGFSSIFWNTAWTHGQKPHTLGILCNPDHPALSGFPTEYHSNWQWWDAMSHSNAIVLDSLPANITPVVRIIDDWFKNRSLALIFEVKVGKGKLIVTGIDLLTDAQNRPEARQLLYSLKKYAASDKFNPDVELKAEDIKRIFN